MHSPQRPYLRLSPAAFSFLEGKNTQIYLKGLDYIDNNFYADNNFYIYNNFYIDNNFIINSVGFNMARIVIENIPEEIKAGFKAICTVHNSTMRNELLNHITSRVGQEIKKTKEGLIVKIK